MIVNSEQYLGNADMPGFWKMIAYCHFSLIHSINVTNKIKCLFIGPLSSPPKHHGVKKQKQDFSLTILVTRGIILDLMEVNKFITLRTFLRGKVIISH